MAKRNAVKKEIKKGSHMHKMPNGHMMKDSEMKGHEKKEYGK